MRRAPIGRRIWLGVAVVLLIVLVVSGFMAPDSLPTPEYSESYKGPLSVFPFGNDDRGISLLPRVLQGAGIILVPALVAASVLMALSTLAGLARSAGIGWFDVVLTGFTELVGALPRLVIILVVAVAIPAIPAGYDALFGSEEAVGLLGGVGNAVRGLISRPSGQASLLPIALTWAILAAPQAMDEAAATAGRLGGARFVEALRAHGFSAIRIYFYHIVWLNLRSVVVRQGAEVITQVAFLEISLSYLARSQFLPAITHSDSSYSWASLLYDGYSWWLTVPPASAELTSSIPVWGQILSVIHYMTAPGAHILAVGLVLLALIALMAHGFRVAARGR